MNMNNKIISTTKSAFRSQFGQLFGPVFTNHSNSLALLDFNQPCIFCSADSGEIPGIYSTALLMESCANKNNISSSSGSGNKFTLKPVDWITMMMNDSGFERRFNDFLELLEEDRKGNTKTENDDLVSICSYSLVTTSTSSSSSKPVLQRKSEWSSTELIQWNIRSFVLATNLAYSFHTALCSDNEQHRNVVTSIPPSARWIQNLFSLSSTVQKRETSSTTTSQSLTEAYNSLLEEQRADSGLYFMLPPLESLVACWNIVQRYGFGVVQIQQQQQHEQSSSVSSIYPTLAPLVSTDFLDRSLPKTTATSNKQQTKKVSSGWSGIKGIKMRNSDDEKRKEQQSPRLRLMTIPQIVQDSTLMSKISFNERESEQDESRLIYVGTRCKKYYLPDALTKKKQTNDQDRSQFNLNSMVGSERWFLVAEK